MEAGAARTLIGPRADHGLRDLAHVAFCLGERYHIRPALTMTALVITGPSALAQSFNLSDASSPFDSGDVLPGAGYSAAETVPPGWDLTSATCSDGSPVDNIDVSPG